MNVLVMPDWAEPFYYYANINESNYLRATEYRAKNQERYKDKRKAIGTLKKSTHGREPGFL